jgi:hypothetical protein
MIFIEKYEVGIFRQKDKKWEAGEDGQQQEGGSWHRLSQGGCLSDVGVEQVGV